MNVGSLGCGNIVGGGVTWVVFSAQDLSGFYICGLGCWQIEENLEFNEGYNRFALLALCALKPELCC